MQNEIFTSKIFIYILFILFAFGQFAAIQKSLTYGVYIYDIWVLLFVLYGIISSKVLILPKSSHLFIIFSFIAWFSIARYFGIISNTEFIFSFAYFIRWFMYLLGAIFVYNLLESKTLMAADIVRAVVFSTTLVSLCGFIQLILYPDMSSLSTIYGWDPHKNRLVSTFLDPNFAGAYINLGIISLFFFKKVFSHKIFMLIGSIHLMALILTFSRSAWLMFALFILVYGWYVNKKLILASFIIFLLIYLAVPRIQTRLSGITDPADSAHFRLISWQNTLTIIKDNFWFGVGYNRLRYVQKDYALFSAGSLGGHAGSGSDSSMLTIFVTTGVFGLIIFSLGFLTNSYHSKFLLAIGISLFAESQFINSLLYPQILFVWLMYYISYSFFDR